LLPKRSTVNLKGFKVRNAAIEGLLGLMKILKLKLETQKQLKPKKVVSVSVRFSKKIVVPKCNKGLY